MRNLTHARTLAIALLGALFAVVTPEQAQAQNAVFTGKVTSQFGQAIEGANVYINDLSISVPTNAQGDYTINIPPSRASGQQVNLRVRALGYAPDVRPVRVSAGSQTINFTLKQDVNRLDEIVVTGSLEGTERAKVPFAVARLSSEDLPVPALDPLRQLQGKVPGVRISQTNGRPGTSPEIMMRGPTSLDASGRSLGPLIIVDGAIMNVGSLEELGGLDIESVEVVKGAAGASLYGTRAANGVITIKTKRGSNRDEVRFNVRSEYGFSDLNSLDYGMPINHHLGLDETGKRFCVQAASNIAACTKSVDWNTEILRINSFKGDTVRTQQSILFNAPAASTGELQNTYQSNIWPNQYYNTFAQIAGRNPIALNAVDATGRVAGVRFYVSGSYQSEQGAIKNLKGSEQRRGRVNLDYDARNDLTVSASAMYDQGYLDRRSPGGSFGALLRGAMAGTNYSMRDSLGRYIIKGGGAGLRGSGNGGGTFLYNLDNDNQVSDQSTNRFLGNLSANYFPADWVTFEGTFAYDDRVRDRRGWQVKGYRTVASSQSTNNGNMQVSTRNEDALNAALTATFRKQLTTDLSGKMSFRALYDQNVFRANNSDGEVFLVKDVYTTTNTSQNFSTGSSEETVKNQGTFAGASADYKGRYIADGTFRYDCSSLFGSGNRCAPFGRLSAVWRVAEESFWNIGWMSDFRLRASRGTAGSTPRFSAQYETYSVSSTGITLGQAGNSKLKPETTTETELGADFTLFNRLGVEVTSARSSTKDQILNVPTPASLGFSTQWQNAGTLANNTLELALNLPVLNRRDLSWSMRGTWDRTRTYIEDLFLPEYFSGATQGSMFLISSRTDMQDGFQVNRVGNIWGRFFYKSCAELPKRDVTVAGVTTSYDLPSLCGPGKEYQVNDDGYVVWVGTGYSWQDGITKNLWQTKLPTTGFVAGALNGGAGSPWNYPLNFGHPIVDRPLRGEPLEGIGKRHILGNTLPDFRMTYSNNVQYKKLTLYALLDGTFGHDIYNQGEQWGLFDFSSNHFDRGASTVESAKPVGYGWRVGGSEGVGTGGFYDILNTNNYSVEDGSYVKVRELSLTYRVGSVRGVGNWTVGFTGRNLMTFTSYTGYDPEVGQAGGDANSGLINQVDAFDFPTLRSLTFTLSTRF